MDYDLGQLTDFILTEVDRPTVVDSFPMEAFQKGPKGGVSKQGGALRTNGYLAGVEATATFNYEDGSLRQIEIHFPPTSLGASKDEFVGIYKRVRQVIVDVAGSPVSQTSRTAASDFDFQANWELSKVPIVVGATNATPASRLEIAIGYRKGEERAHRNPLTDLFIY